MARVISQIRWGPEHPDAAQDDLYRNRLENSISRKNPMVHLADTVDREAGNQLPDEYHEEAVAARPTMLTRLTAAKTRVLVIRRSTGRPLGRECLLTMFCGETPSQHTPPIHTIRPV